MSEKRKLNEPAEDGINKKKFKIDYVDNDEDKVIEKLLQINKKQEPAKQEGSSQTRKLKSCECYTAYPPNYVEKEFVMPEKMAREWPFKLDEFQVTLRT